MLIAVVVIGVVLHQVLVQHAQLLLVRMVFAVRTVAGGRAVRRALLVQVMHR